MTDFPPDMPVERSTRLGAVAGASPHGKPSPGGASGGLVSLSASDAALAARVACGDAEALRPLYQRHRGAVYRFALLWSGAPATAADVTQDVFLHLISNAGDYDAARGPLLPWLLGIARNFAYRRAGVDARYAPEDDEDEAAAGTSSPQEEALDTQRDLARLRAAIAALPPHYRDVLVLVELAERSYAEAAAICGCELNTVRSRLFRARALVARSLSEARDDLRTARG